MKRSRYAVGQLVTHVQFQYRGVIVDVDPEFSLAEAWYDAVARTRPPKDEPWYRVLVDGTAQETYVAERNLLPEAHARPIEHPDLHRYLVRLEDGQYVRNRLHLN